MDILFTREQSSGSVARVNFKLWCKIELSEEEQTLVDHYDLDKAVLIEGDEQVLIRHSAYVGLAAFVLSLGILIIAASASIAFMLALLAGGGAGFWWFNEKRETILVRDVMHGRYFKCKSVIDLAKKEAHLGGVIASLSAVIAGAKHWDGEERHTVEVPNREEAKQLLASL